MKKTFVMLVLLCCVPLTFAYDIELSLIPEEFPLDGTITHLFRIENLDFISGQTYSIDVNLSYNITTGNSSILLLNGTSQHSINKYTTNTASFVFNASAIEELLICGKARVAEDDVESNNQGCWKLRLAEEEDDEEEYPIDENKTDDNTSYHNETDSGDNETEDHLEYNCSSMRITGLSQSSASGEQLHYRFEPWLAGDEVVYWWEDLWGEVVKQEVVTSRNAERRYTPRTTKEQEALILNGLRRREGCPDELEQRLVVIVGEQGDESSGGAGEDEETIEDSLDLVSVSQDASEGESMMLAIEASKKDNRLRVISIDAGVVEEKIRLKEKGSYSFEVPLMLPCGEHNILIEGLGDSVESNVRVLCAEEDKNSEDKKECVGEEKDNPVSSAYVRAQKWSEEINLYGSLEEGYAGMLCEVLGEVEGEFKTSIKAKVGENTFAVIAHAKDEEEGEEELSGRLVQFSLEGEEEKEKNESTQEENEQRIENSARVELTGPTNDILTGSATKEVSVLEKKRTIIPYLGLVIILLGLGVFLKGKGKDLRTKNVS